MQAFIKAEETDVQRTARQQLGLEDEEPEHDSREGVSTCDEHNEPLNFWSKKLNRYQCIRCLVDEKEVHYIDKSYVQSFEKFKNMQNVALRTLHENAPMDHVIRDWKDDIRDILGRIHNQFIDMITEYTRKFYRSLLHIETSDKMKQFYREDSRQSQRLDYMNERYIEMKAIIDEIE